jgi:hypothetical protein
MAKWHDVVNWDNPLYYELWTFRLAVNSDGRLEVFGIDSSTRQGSLWHNYQTEVSEDWSGWQPMEHPPVKGGVCPNAFAVDLNSDDKLQVVVRCDDDNFWYRVQDSRGEYGWGDWQLFDSPQTGINSDSVLAAGRDLDNAMVLLAISADNDIYQRRENSNGTGWTGWDRLDTPPGRKFERVRLFGYSDGRLIAIARTVPVRPYPAELWRIWQEIDGNWRSDGGKLLWEQINGPQEVELLTPIIVRNEDGRAEMISIGTNGEVYYTWQDDDFGWTEGWHKMEKPLFDARQPPDHVFAAIDRNGLINIFVTNESGDRIFQAVQKGKNGLFGGWKPFKMKHTTPYTNGYITQRIAPNGDGRLEIVAFTTSDRQICHKWEE